MRLTPPGGHHVAGHLTPLHPSDMTPTERAAAVAAFPPLADRTNSRVKTGEST
jgi:hypothetical protein